MTTIPEPIKQQLLEWSEKAELDNAILEGLYIQMFDKLKEQIDDLEDEETLHDIVKDRLYAKEVRDYLKSKADTYYQMFIGVTGLNDRNSIRRGMCARAKAKDFDWAMEKGYINEDGVALTKGGKKLQPWHSRSALFFSVKRSEQEDNPDKPPFRFMIGQLNGFKATHFGKPARRGVDPLLRPEIGQWYQVRWVEAEDKNPMTISIGDEEYDFNCIGRSAKPTNFGMVTDIVNLRGIDALKANVNDFPDVYRIPIPHDELDEWYTENVILETTASGKIIKNYNVFGLISGRLMQVSIGDDFGSITLKHPGSDDEIRITFSSYVLTPMLKGVGIGSSVSAFAMPYPRDEKDAEGKVQSTYYEARGLGLVVTRLIPPIDIDDIDEVDDDDDDEDGEIMEI